MIEKLRIPSVNRNRYLEKKIIDISEQYLVLEADIYKINKFQIINESCWMPQADVRALPESSLLRCFATAFITLILTKTSVHTE